MQEGVLVSWSPYDIAVKTVHLPITSYNSKVPRDQPGVMVLQGIL